MSQELVLSSPCRIVTGIYRLVCAEGNGGFAPIRMLHKERPVLSKVFLSTYDSIGEVPPIVSRTKVVCDWSSRTFGRQVPT